MKYIIFILFLSVFLITGCLDRTQDISNKNNNIESCESQADCELTEFCNPSTLKCEILNACDCKDGEICEPFNKKCIEYESKLCEPCENHGDCGIDMCLSLETGKACSSFCDENLECPTGFECKTISDAFGEATGLSQCYPTNNQCKIVNKCELIRCESGYTCDEKTGECKAQTECSSNLDCLNGEYCNQDTKKCEENNKCALIDCQEGYFCDQNTGECKPVIVQECTKKSDCEENEFCNKTTFKCEEIVGCQSNNDCDEGYFCNMQKSLCMPKQEGCQSDADCADNQVCNLDMNKCVPRAVECRNDSECDFGLYCNLDYYKCMPEATFCYSNNDCDFGEICDLDYNKCVTEQNLCYSNDDCDFGEVCNLEFNKCVFEEELCNSDEECGFGQYCDLNTGSCEFGQSEGCQDDNDCSDGLTCQLGYCTGCETDADCPIDQTCQDLMGFLSYCAEGGTTDQRCFSNDQCDTDKSCDFVSGDCHFTDGHCDDNEDCKGELECRSIFGQSSCQGCEADGDCYMGQSCLFGMCTATSGSEGCETAEDCFIPGQICIAGSCVGGGLPTP